MSQDSDGDNDACAEKLLSNFKYVASSVPFRKFKTPPFQGEITGWYKYEELYIAKTSKPEANFMYCPIHDDWYKIPRFQMYYVTRHLERTHQVSVQNSAANKKRKVMNLINGNLGSTLTLEQMNIIKKELQKYLLFNCRPFSDADDLHLHKICASLNSDSLRANAVEIAKATKKELKVIISNSLFTRPSIDEWEDAKKRRYVGETIYCLHDGKWEPFVIALKEIKALHATAEEIANILDNIDIEYNIDSSKERYCSDNCNVMLSVQTVKGIARFPCILHAIHNIVGNFLEGESDFKQEISSLTNKLHSCPVFTSYCEHNVMPKIPQFTEIRWTSVCDTLVYFSRYKNELNEYFLSTKEKIRSSLWDDIEENKKFFTTVVSCCKLIEGDEFGQISKVHAILNTIEKSIKKMSSKYNASKELALTNLHSFESKFSSDLYPIIYAAEFLNPELMLGLNSEEQTAAIKYIKNRASLLGYPVPERDKSKEMNSKNSDDEDDNSIIHYTTRIDSGFLLDELSTNRAMLRESCSLLQFWLEKLNSVETKGIALVALEVLSTLCNSASVEREFSKAKRIITMQRVQLLPEISEDLLIIAANKEISEKYFI